MLNNRLIKGKLLFILILICPAIYSAPRTEWGQPDLQGVWNFSSSVPMQRPVEFGVRQFLTQEEVSKGVRHFELGAGVGVIPPNRFGIEAYYKNYDARTVKQMLKIANKYNLYPIGGSDYHGIHGNKEKLPGKIPLPDKIAIELIKKHLKIK